MLAELSSNRNRAPLDPSDEETGLPLVDEKEKDAKEGLLNVVQEGAEYQDFREHPAWKKLSGYLKEQAEVLKKNLVVERKQQKIMRLQEQIQTLEFLPNLVDSFITDAEAAQELLKARFNSDRE